MLNTIILFSYVTNVKHIFAVQNKSIENEEDSWTLFYNNGTFCLALDLKALALRIETSYVAV